MEEQISDLNQLLKKYKTEIESLEVTINQKKEKLNVIYEALNLLQQEGVTKQSLSSKTESVTEKYKDVSLSKAILFVLSSSKQKYLNGVEIYNDLIKNGFESGSGNIQRDVYISLYRLEKDHKIIARKSGSRKTYMFKHTEQ